MFARTAVTVLSLIVAVAAAAGADQQYTIDAHDTFSLGGTSTRSEVAYAGTGRLHAVPAPTGTRFTTVLTYDRTKDGTRTRAKASFETTIRNGGAQLDAAVDDPDYLTILNQPFAVWLDAATLHDLSAFRGSIPFDVPSPIVGATLHGALRRLPDGVLHGERVLGVAFIANGPLHGTLPDRPGQVVSGAIIMSGRAYYAYANALLVGLDAVLSIDGNVEATGGRDPVNIVYRRSIRPFGASPAAKR